MSNGDDDSKVERPDSGGQGKKPASSSRKRRAARPPTIDGKATELQSSEPGTAGPGDLGDAATKAPGTPSDAMPDPTGEDTVAGTTAAETDAEVAGESTGEATTESTGETAAEPTVEAADTDGEPVSIAAGSEDSGDTASADAEPGAGETQPDDTAAVPAGAAHTPIPTARRASLIASGLIGALIALAIYLGLYYGGVLPRDQRTMTEALQAQAQELGRRIATLESGAARDARRDLEADITQLKSALEELGSDPANSVLKRVRKLESSFGLSSSDDDGTPSASLADRLASIEESLSKAGESVTSGAQAGIADLMSRIESLEQRPPPATGDRATGDGATGDGATGDGTSDSAAPVAALSDRIASLSQQIQATAKQVDDLAKSGAASTQDVLAGLQSNLASMRTELDKLSSTVAASASAVDDKLAAFRQSLADGDSEAVRQVARTTAGALALTGLIKTVDSGAPYTAELEVLTPLVGDKADLTVLTTYARTGVPDVQALATRFDAVARDILTAGDPTENGLVGTLMTSARSLVQVRPASKTEGTGRGAIVSRIEAALEAGDLTTAEAEWSSLDAEAQKVSASWADDLKARIAVNQALESVSGSLTTSLTGEAKSANTGAADAAAAPVSQPEAPDVSGTGKSGGKSGNKSGDGKTADAESGDAESGDTKSGDAGETGTGNNGTSDADATDTKPDAPAASDTGSATN